MKRYDHVALALSRLPTRLRKPKWMALTAALARSRQKLEDAIQLLSASMAIDFAEGFLLTQIGALVGQPRDTTDDVVYRRRIRAKIALNRSSGLPDDILRIVELVANNPAVHVDAVTSPPATLLLFADGAPIGDGPAADIASFAQRAVSSGVRVLFLSGPADDDDMFTLDYIREDFVDGSFGSDVDLFSTVNDYGVTDDWPETGTLQIDGDDYVYRKTAPGTFLVSPPVPGPLVGGEQVLLQLDVGGKGLGNDAEPGHPTLVPYTSPGTTGGQLADVR